MLKDLCARLPYGVMCNVFNGKYDEDMKLSPSLLSRDINDVKPYLRPMSSMTEEESEEYRMFIDYSYNDFTSESTRVFMRTQLKTILIGSTLITLITADSLRKVLHWKRQKECMKIKNKIL